MKTKIILIILAITLVQGAQALTLDTSANTNLNTNTSSSSAAGLKVDAKLVGSTGTVSTASTTADVGLYSENMPFNDTFVVSYDTTQDSEVTVVYKRPAKLFGFFDMDLTEKATIAVDKNGTVKAQIRKSWWAFLAIDESRTGEFRSALQSRVATRTTASVEGDVKLTQAEKNQFLADINAASEATYK